MRIAALDVLRFLAALSVVIYHYIARPEASAFSGLEPFARFGYLGVPIFFMISGYVIALSAEGRSAYQFAVSRFVRLYPALWFAVLFTVLVNILFSENTYSLQKVLANFTLLNDYLGIPNVDGVYWTLQAELKFYACVFLLVAFGIYEKYKVWLSAWLLMTFYHLFIEPVFFMGWFISPSYSPYFIVGIAFYLIQKRGFSGFNTVILLLSSGLCIYQAGQQANGFLHDYQRADGHIASVIVMASIILFIAISKGVIRLKESRFLFTLGALTYPLYLLHNSAGKALIDASVFSAVSESLKISVVTVFMLLASYGVYRYIEQPLSKWLKSMLVRKGRNE